MKRSVFLFEYTEGGEKKDMLYYYRDEMKEMAALMSRPGTNVTEARVTEFQQIETKKLK